MSDTDLAVRYGSRPSWQTWALRGAVAAVVLVLAAGLAVFLPSLADPEASSGNLTFEILDDRTAVASFSVEVDDEVDEATCTVRAYAEDHTLVGNLSFAVTEGSGRVEQAITTERRATSVELVGCTTPGQNRPR